jgi:aspartokinase
VKKLITLAGMFLVLAAVSGCGNSADAAVKDYLKAMDDMSESLEKKAGKDEINAKGKKLEEAGKKLEALKLSKEEKDKLAEKHKDAIKKSGERFTAALMAGAMPDLGGINFGGSPFGGAPKGKG